MKEFQRLKNLELHHRSRANQYKKMVDDKYPKGISAGHDLAPELYTFHNDIADAFFSEWTHHMSVELFYKFKVDLTKSENVGLTNPEKVWRATIDDQDIVLASEDPYYAYIFAKAYPEADIAKLQEIAARYADWAYFFALNVKGADIALLQEAVMNTFPQSYLIMNKKVEPENFHNATYCKLFAKNIPGADTIRLNKIQNEPRFIRYSNGEMIWKTLNAVGDLVVTRIHDDMGIEYQYDVDGNLLSKKHL